MTSLSWCEAATSTPGCSGTTRCANHAIYGSYGISVFAVRDLTLDKLAQHVPKFDSTG